MPDLATSPPPRRRVFISYSWDSDAHKQWVVHLAQRITQLGFDVEYDRSTTERRLTLFMERGIRDSDRVVVVCTPEYRQRADDREHGVGYEYDLLATLILNGHRDKIIPILRAGDYGIGPTAGIPFAIAGMRGPDFREDSQFEDKLDELRREILGQPPLSSLEDEPSSQATPGPAQGGMLPAAPAAQTLPAIAISSPSLLPVLVGRLRAAARAIADAGSGRE